MADLTQRLGLGWNFERIPLVDHGRDPQASVAAILEVHVGPIYPAFQRSLTMHRRVSAGPNQAADWSDQATICMNYLLSYTFVGEGQPAWFRYEGIWLPETG